MSSSTLHWGEMKKENKSNGNKKIEEERKTHITWIIQNSHYNEQNEPHFYYIDHNYKLIKVTDLSCL